MTRSELRSWVKTCVIVGAIFTLGLILGAWLGE